MKVVIKILLSLLILFLAIQVLPMGRNRTNPPVTREPSWDSPRTRELAQRACFDCHSNETKWPWYASVAPVSWLVKDDVMKGRRHLNFSEFDKPQPNADDAPKEIMEKEMPMTNYLLMHPEARLTDEERKELAGSFRKMFADWEDNDVRGDEDDY